jgi:TatD DNase family protein
MSVPAIIDSHCHLSDSRVFDRAEEVIEECARAGIRGFLLGGTDPAEWERQRDLEARYPGRVFKVLGLHPWWVDGLVEGEETEAPRKLGEALQKLEAAASDPGVVALGETGLDAARGRMKRSSELQQRAFRAQLDLALRLRKPLVLHVVRAHSEAIRILSEPEFRDCRGLVHSFSGGRQEAKKYLDAGWLLSFSARITHPDASELRETLRECPADRLLFETDSPDQAPFGNATAIHSPVSLFKVVEKASEIREEKPGELLALSQRNLVRAFALSER